MSSAGRGKRGGGDADYFPTPGWCVDRLIERYRLPHGAIVEPSAGDGSIIRSCGGNKPPFRRWHACEIDSRFVFELQSTGVRVVVGDYLKITSITPDPENVSLVIGNPPYSLAEQFVRHSRELFPEADIVFLLRLNFLGSEERIALYSEIGVPDVMVLPNRPPFSRNKLGKIGTDSCEYGWFRWPVEPRRSGQNEILASTPAAVRAGHVFDLERKLSRFATGNTFG